MPMSATPPDVNPETLIALSIAGAVDPMNNEARLCLFMDVLLKARAAIKC